MPGSKLRRTWPLDGGMSAQMAAIEVETPIGQTVKRIVRWHNDWTYRCNPHAVVEEFKTLQLAHTLELAAPTPYHLDESCSIFSKPYMVVEYIEGNPKFTLPPGFDFTFNLAKHLARIHSADLSDKDVSFLSEHQNRCAETLDEPTTEGTLNQGRIHDTLRAAEPLRLRNKPVLLHGDYWPGNVLWRDTELVAVIDWEDASRGDPLTDFAISRLDFLWILGIDAFHSFTEHYESLMRIDYSNLPYWDLCAALRTARFADGDIAG